MSVSSRYVGSSGSSSFGGRNFAKVGGRRCKCGISAIVYTSKTQTNFNRAFLGCPYFKEKKPYCDYFRWVDDAGNEEMELEEGRIYKEVAEMDFKLKYVVMKLNEQEMKINEQDRKLKELSLKMVSDLDTMEKNFRHLGRPPRVVIAIFVGLVMLCIFLGCKLTMKENVPKVCLPE